MNIDKFTFKQKQSLVPVCYVIVMKIALAQHRSYYIHGEQVSVRYFPRIICLIRKANQKLNQDVFIYLQVS